MRKIIEVDKFFVNSVFFMKKTCFFSNFRFYTSNLLIYFSYLLFWFPIQDPASKEWSAPAKSAWTTAKSLHWHLALVRKDEGLIVGRRVTGSSPDTEAAGLRKIEHRGSGNKTRNTTKI